MINTIIEFERSLINLKNSTAHSQQEENNVQHFFEKFEKEAEFLDDNKRDEIVKLIEQKIHPLLKQSEFFRRAYDKPLGYAGDYLTVLMLTNSQQCIGSNHYEKMINKLSIENGPSQGHKNRISIIEQQLHDLVLNTDDCIKILSIGAGPALEVKALLKLNTTKKIEITLLDNNLETIQYIEKSYQSTDNITIKTIQASVKDIIRGSVLPLNEYSMSYCTGLFDYLSARLCSRVIDQMKKSTIAGGDILISNLNISTPYKHRMELLADWKIIYRSPTEFADLFSGDSEIFFDQTETNMFLKIKNV